MDLAAAAVGTVPDDEEGRDGGEKLFDLFRKPLGRSRPRPDERPVMERARVGDLTLDGRKTVVYRWGEGERPVLLVHGWESRASRYAKVIGRLTELGLSAVAFDAPGHGESEGDTTTLLEYRDIITRLHRVHGDFGAVVAHSFGVLASVVALRRGVGAGRLAAISPVPDFAYLVDAFRGRMRLRQEQEDELRGRIERDLYPGEDMWRRFTVFPAPTDPRLPVLVVHDEDDEAVDPERAHRLAAAHGARARLVTTRRFGHRRILGSPQVVEEVAAFVAAGAGVTPR
ncbi:hypothetical protein SUDANB176_06026 [Streptomyces sp. enrichment culture]|uniref:alpha/beta hydrolase n=1 Tax=Streptomyces sp. enrichment culture TaxID=1795815 RepID=UPI003F569D57